MPEQRSEPTIVSFTGALEGAHGQREDSLQVPEGASVLLRWKASGADAVELEEVAGKPRRIAGSSGSATVKPHGPLHDFTLVALSGAARSAPAVVHVSMHAPHEVISGHAHMMGPPVFVWLAIEDEDHKPRAGLAYTLRAGKTALKGITAADGELQAHLPGGHDHAELTLHAERDEAYQLVFDGGTAAQE